ncbi:radical SAM [Cyanobium sp. PCC 7001]|uniref:7-carboxy-7-deazaguanine synthase QueE n=1 Tax=Cyanobium sp. PCC 7001 TaxID=180281 RepID=UPI000180597E|nr:7-carboxy-7-deazaguanine synthase QueE [Cyanobium sp. PCC 7001]EDY38700.1 radical SAM [Cyanobium sp. PCC 7001]
MPPRNPGALPVVEAFHSLQGEGLHTGQSAFFIRLAGCRVGCSWCDTKHSWPMAGHAEWSLSGLADAALAARQAGAGFVVITGGEPLHHDLTALCALLRSHGLRLHLETSGVEPLRGQVDWIVLSPKRHQPPRDDLIRLCNELKVVVHSHDDLDFALAMARQANASGNHPALLLQPGWESTEGQRLALDFVRSHADWRLSLQSHKWLAIR